MEKAKWPEEVPVLTELTAARNALLRDSPPMLREVAEQLAVECGAGLANALADECGLDVAEPTARAFMAAVLLTAALAVIGKETGVKTDAQS